MGVLTDASCPSVQPTWYELSLKSELNRSKLHRQIENPAKQRSYFLASFTALRNRTLSCQSHSAVTTIRGGDIWVRFQ
jgi:hypothetical protein